MNILDHINAGHYPKDEKGRALVPTAMGVATICATDAPGEWKLQGWHDRAGSMGSTSQASWHPDGRAGAYMTPNDFLPDLLPPPPRKVSIKAWAVVGRPSTGIYSVHTSLGEAEKNCASAVSVVVPVTGEVEVPWQNEMDAQPRSGGATS